MGAQSIQCQVVSNQFITPTTFLLRFHAEPQFKYQSGQFISTIIPGAGPKGRDLRRAYSFASYPEEKFLELCIRKVDNGPGSSYLASLKEGDSFQALAPYGDFVYRTTSDRIPFFVATGTGIAPFRSMMLSEHFQSHPPKKAYCLFGTTVLSELLYVDLSQSVAQLEMIVCCSREESVSPASASEGRLAMRTGRVTTALQEMITTLPLKAIDFYLCGNGAMIKEVKEILKDADVPKESIFQEKYY
jgi:ferredoxin-NADP reductase